MSFKPLTRHLLLSLCLSGAVLATASAAPDAAMSLNGAWQFTFVRDPSQVASLEQSFYKPDFDASSFQTIRVPANWAMEGFEEPYMEQLNKLQTEAGTGFYVYRFKAPAEWKQNRVLLHFDGVWSSAEVWLNGVNLGRHDSGFTSFAFEINRPLTHDEKNVLKPGEVNTLAVEVRQITRDWGYDCNDDWSLGGVYRDVWIECMPLERYIDHVDSWVDFDDHYCDADLNVRAFVYQGRGKAVSGLPYELHAVLEDTGGQVVAETRIAASPHRDMGREHEFKLHVFAPKHWNAETPNLYTFRVELLQEGKVVQTSGHRVGFREVAAKNGTLTLNGRPIKIRGVCRHDSHPDVGNATRREHWLEDLRLMKDANINAIRMVHYPPARGFLDLCDEMGMYIFDEVPMGYKGSFGVDPSFTSAVMVRTCETITRDRNHPSVIAWDVGNENPMTPLHLTAIRCVKGNDPTRPVTLPEHSESWLPPDVDILTTHYPPTGWAEFLVAGATRPLVATEYSHALSEWGFGDHASRWEALSRSPSGAGGMIWMWQDQGLWQKRPTESGTKKELLLELNGTDGIVTSDRKPQRDFWEAKAVYAPVRVLAEKIDVDYQPRTVSIPVRNDFDFTDLNQVTVRWKVFSGEREVKQGETHLNALPHMTANLDLPVNCDPGQPCYAHISFLRSDGSLMTERSVVFADPAATPAPPARARLREGKLVVLETAGTTYEFDPATGLLAGAAAKGRRLIAGMRPTIWRPLNTNEQYIYFRQHVDSPKFPDLDQNTVSVKSWRAKPDGIEAETEHRIDERNKFSVRWTYTPLADGSLRIAYVITPQIEVKWVPEVGLELKTADGLDRLRWLGLGPLDAFPNLKAAVLFGTWQLDAQQATGVKMDVHWAELTAADGKGVRIEGSPYTRMAGPGRWRLLNAVEGRPGGKSQRAEKVEDHLDAVAGPKFSGSVTLRLMP